MIDLSSGKQMATISQADLFEQIEYSPHAGQRKFHNKKAQARFRLASCGRRYGKSQLGGHELTTAAMWAHAMQASLEPKGKRHEYWIVGPEYSDSEKEFRVVYNDLKKLDAPFDRPGTYYSEDATSMRISLFGGRFLIAAKSAKHPETLVGEGLMGVIMAEAAKLKEVVWTKSIRPTLSDYASEGSWATFTSTPEGKNWFYRQYMRGQDPEDKLWWSMRAPSWHNDILFPFGKDDPEIVDLQKDMSDEKFKQEIGAEFTEFVGRVFKDFDEDSHVGRYPYDPKLPVYIAADKGFRNPSVVLFIQVDRWDTVTVIGEYYQTGRTAEETAQDVWDAVVLGPLARVAIQGYPDPASPEWAAALESKWSVRMTGVETGGDLTPRLDLIRRWLRPPPFELEDGHPEKLPKLRFDFSCTHSIREMNDYRYPDSRSEAEANPREAPMKKDDHVPEALGRFFLGKFGKLYQESEQTHISRARMGVTR